MSATDVCLPRIVKIEKCTEYGKNIDCYFLYIILNVFIIAISICFENGFSFIYVLKKPGFFSFEFRCIFSIFFIFVNRSL